MEGRTQPEGTPQQKPSYVEWMRELTRKVREEKEPADFPLEAA